jgi:hypothetical protein
MRLKWFKLAAAVVMLGTSAQAEWQFSVIEGKKLAEIATSVSVADWREILVSALTINIVEEPNYFTQIPGAWELLYVHPDGSIWDCYLKTNHLGLSYCLVRR